MTPSWTRPSIRFEPSRLTALFVVRMPLIAVGLRVVRAADEAHALELILIGRDDAGQNAQQLERAAADDREVVDLGGRQPAFARARLGLDDVGGRRDDHRLALRAELQLDVEAADVVRPEDDGGLLERLEPGELDGEVEGAGKRPGKVKPPRASVTAVRTAFVPTSSSVTEAPGVMPPEPSATLPRNVAVVPPTCAADQPDVPARTAAAQMNDAMRGVLRMGWSWVVLRATRHLTALSGKQTNQQLAEERPEERHREAPRQHLPEKRSRVFAGRNRGDGERADRREGRHVNDARRRR